MRVHGADFMQMLCFVIILAYPGFVHAAYTLMRLICNWIIPKATLEASLSKYDFIASFAFLTFALVFVFSVCPVDSCILTAGFTWPQWFNVPEPLSLPVDLLAGVFLGISYYFVEASVASWSVKFYRSDSTSETFWTFGQTRRIVKGAQQLPTLFLLFLIASKATLEEVLWRGFVFIFAVDVLDLPQPHAIAISSVAFGISHFSYGIANILSKTLFGGILCMVYSMASSLIPAILCHQAFNFMVFRFRIEWHR
ncbi:MAG: CPBP family intramembrane metalloprotease [Gemmatimonadota bacterium]|nr:CPBP family intramembrane metalloprotease [Gemmatimonadota bacterium]